MHSIKEVIALYRSQKKINNKIIKLGEQIEKLQVAKQHQKYLRSIAEQVSFIHRGVPIHFNTHNGKWGTFTLVVPDTRCMLRKAEIYPNASHTNLWGIRVWEYNYKELIVPFKCEIWLGAAYPSQKVVRKMALDFLIDGLLPAERARKYH